MLNLLRTANDLSQQATIYYVPLSKLEDNPYQTRQRNVVGHIMNLAASIVRMAPSLPDTKGLQQLPVGRLVRYADGYAYPDDVYEDEAAVVDLLAGNEVVVELAFGHSRRLAFLMLARGVAAVFPESGYERIEDCPEYDAADYAAMPVLLRPLTDQEMWSHATTENAQRRDLSAIEEAIAIERARKEFGMTYEQAGKLFGKSRGAAANLVRLLQLPDEYQQAILDGRITERHGRALLPLLEFDGMWADFPIAYLMGQTASNVESQVQFRIEMRRQAMQVVAEKRKPLLSENELIALAERFLDVRWKNRDLPENPAHSNGTLWQEINAWLTAERGETHQWREGDLKQALRLAVHDRQMPKTTTFVTSYAPAPQTPTPQMATRDQVAAAFAAWLTEKQPTLADLKQLRREWTFAPLWWPTLIYLKEKCSGAGIVDLFLSQLLDEELRRRTASVQEQRSASLVEVFPTTQAPLVDRQQLMDWHVQFAQCIDALGDYAVACGQHQAEIGNAVRSLRFVLEHIEEEMGNEPDIRR